MNVGIVGSRDFSPESAVRHALRGLKEHHGPDLRIVTGDADGVDAVVRDVAPEYVGPEHVIVETANWDIGRAAGPERNARLVARVDMLLAFFHPRPLARLPETSPGTFDCIRQARRRGVPIHIWWEHRWLTAEDVWPERALP